MVKGGENGKDGFGLGSGACGEVDQQKVGRSTNLKIWLRDVVYT
jgi:hypothetical protein